MASTVADILLELVESGSYLKDVDAAATVRKNIIASLCAKIKQLKCLSTGDAVKLRDSVTSAGFPEATTITLKESIDNALESSLSGDHDDKKPAMTQQQLPNACSYPSGQDWVIIEQQPFNVDRAIATLASRWSKLGIRSMHETTTVRSVVAIVLAAYLREKRTWPRYHEIFRWVNNFKSEIERFKKPWAFDHIVKYPNSPMDLPGEIMAHAYDADDVPVRKEIPMFDQIVTHIPLRKNSIFLVNERAAMSALHQHGGLHDDFGETPIPGLRIVGKSRQRKHMHQMQMHQPSALPALCDVQYDWQTPEQHAGAAASASASEQPHGFGAQPSVGPAQQPQIHDQSQQAGAPARLPQRFKLGGALASELGPKPKASLDANVEAKTEKVTAAEAEELAFMSLKKRNKKRAAMKKPASAKKLLKAEKAEPDDDEDEVPPVKGIKAEHASEEEDSDEYDEDEDEEEEEDEDDEEDDEVPPMKAMKAVAAMKAKDVTAPKGKTAMKATEAAPIVLDANAKKALAAAARATDVSRKKMLSISSIGSFTSCAFRCGERCAKANGCSVKVALLVARTCYKKAKQAWDAEFLNAPMKKVKKKSVKAVKKSTKAARK